MQKPDHYFSLYSAILAVLICIVGLGILAAPSKSGTQDGVSPAPALPWPMLHTVHALPAVAPRTAPAQDAGQAAPAPAAQAAPKPVELPEGDGKPIATEYCQMCHKLTNLTKAHKDLDDWKDTIQTMIDRGAAIPDDKVDTLAKYLAANFGPKDATAAANAPAPAATTMPAAAPTAPASSPTAAVSAPPAPATAAVVLPDGDGKAIATENCQACHKLTNLTKAHKNLDDWKETVQTMIDRGANVPADQVDTLVQYLAKNFGPKDASGPAVAAPPAFTPAQ